MMDAQIILNIAFGTIMFLGGWLMKLILGHINEIKSNHEKLLIKHIEDMESLLEKHTNLALSMPEAIFRIICASIISLPLITPKNY